MYKQLPELQMKSEGAMQAQVRASDSGEKRRKGRPPPQYRGWNSGSRTCARMQISTKGSGTISLEWFFRFQEAIGTFHVLNRHGTADVHR
jgi:hypothetical protein